MASPSCWSSSAWQRHWSCPTMAMCWKPGTWCWTDHMRHCLAIGRGLASAPRLIMLDEPSMGLAPAVADTIFERISQIHREDGVTILLVEQRVAEALELSDHGYVLETGHMVLDGSYETLLGDRPRSRLRAAADHAGRTLDGPCTRRGRYDLRAYLADPSRGWRHHPAGRAARGRGTGAVRPWLCAGNRAHGAGRII